MATVAFAALSIHICRAVRARFALTLVKALCAGLVACGASAHRVSDIQIGALCKSLEPACVHSAMPGADAARFALQSAHAVELAPSARAVIVADNRAPPGGSSLGKRKPPGIGGVIDPSVPQPSSALSSNEANLTQFNRLSEGSAFAGSMAVSSPAALPDPDGGPVLFTILERAPGIAQQAQPVVYTQPAPGAPRVPRAHAKSSAKRYCTVTEVLHSTSAHGCR
jgi:hypothetical protein